MNKKTNFWTLLFALAVGIFILVLVFIQKPFWFYGNSLKNILWMILLSLFILSLSFGLALFIPYLFKEKTRLSGRFFTWISSCLTLYFILNKTPKNPGINEYKIIFYLNYLTLIILALHSIMLFRSIYSIIIPKLILKAKRSLVIFIVIIGGFFFACYNYTLEKCAFRNLGEEDPLSFLIISAFLFPVAIITVLLSLGKTIWSKSNE